MFYKLDINSWRIREADFDRTSNALLTDSEHYKLFIQITMAGLEVSKYLLLPPYFILRFTWRKLHWKSFSPMTSATVWGWYASPATPVIGCEYFEEWDRWRCPILTFFETIPRILQSLLNAVFERCLIMSTLYKVETIPLPMILTGIRSLCKRNIIRKHGN